MTDKEKVFSYLAEHTYMTLATASADGKPEAATVEYIVDGDMLLINTYVHYRKYENLQQNQRVSCVVTDDTYEATLQIDGIAVELQGSKADRAKEIMLDKDPGFADFFNDTKTRFFCIQPVWIRLRDYRSKPMTVIEIEL